MPPVHRPARPRLQLLRLDDRLVDGGDDEVLEHRRPSGRRTRVDLERRSSKPPVMVTVTMPPPAEASTVLLFASSCASSICCWQLLRLRIRREIEAAGNPPPPSPPPHHHRALLAHDFSPRRRRSALSRCRRSVVERLARGVLERLFAAPLAILVEPCAPRPRSGSRSRRHARPAPTMISTARSSPMTFLSAARSCGKRRAGRSAVNSLSNPSDRCTRVARRAARDCARAASSGSISVTASTSSVKLVGATRFCGGARRSPRCAARVRARVALRTRCRRVARRALRLRLRRRCTRLPPPSSTRDSSAPSLAISSPIGSSGSTRLSSTSPTSST